MLNNVSAISGFCEKLDRNSIGIELNPDYCDIIRRRMAGLEVNLFLAK